jgi:hypothetical protein
MAIIFAEIAAAELAAAAAAEAAAVTAAEVAAAEAASVAAAEAASTAAAQAATQAAAQQATTAGIMEVGGATANPLTLTPEAVQNAAMNSGMPEVMSPAQQAYQAASSASATPGITPGVQPLPAPTNAFPSYPPLESTNNPFNRPFPEYPNFQAAPPAAPPSPPPVNTMGLNMPGSYVPEPMYSGMGMESQIPANQFIEPGSAGMPSMENTIAQANVPVTPPSGLEAGFDKALKFAEKNPFTAMTGAYMGASALGLLNPSGATFNNTPYNGPLSKYKLAPNFQGSFANPANFQYNPATNRRYAGGGILDAMGGGGSGGISANGNIDLHIPIGFGDNNNNVGGYQSVGANNMSPSATNNFAPQQMLGANNNIDVGGNESIPSYARGGSLSESIEQYQKMLGGQPQAAPTRSPDVGIYYDQDPDTRYQDALTAAQIRQAKVNKRANMQLPGPKRPTPMGQLNLKPVGSAATASESTLDPETAAQGGIMHSSLGGYAAGGNPRLLKGPGDGMSDNIPATINGRQPARLADGEFVIPADVVSHLGNGSTEAGAKHLHTMMNKVRSARTGNPKQGKQINAKKYMPK